MKRSEATPELLKSLDEPGMLYLFDEDIEEMDFVFSYIRKKGWSRTGLTDTQRQEIRENLAIEMKKKYGDDWVEVA